MLENINPALFNAILTQNAKRLVRNKAEEQYPLAEVN